LFQFQVYYFNNVSLECIYVCIVYIYICIVCIYVCIVLIYVCIVCIYVCIVCIYADKSFTKGCDVILITINDFIVYQKLALTIYIISQNIRGIRVSNVASTSQRSYY
jgi:hypothetical protein